MGDFRPTPAKGFCVGKPGTWEIARKGKSPKAVRGGRKRRFGPRTSPKSLLHHQKPLSISETHFVPMQQTFRPLGPKDLLQPLLTTSGDFHFSGNFPGPWLANPFGNGTRGHYERGLFVGGISRISKRSLESRQWPDSPSFPHSGGLSRISKISRMSRK